MPNAQKKLETRDDLLDLLNLVKEEELKENGLLDKYHPFTQEHISYYCNPKNAFHRYRHFQIPKKSGGFRQITTPRNRSFMLILNCLNTILKSVYTPSAYAMGFTEGRSVVTNAEVHKGMNYILNIDLKDFFPSIDQARVWKRLQLEPFNFPNPVASIIAGMCCMKDKHTLEDGNTEIRYVLPQGAPTSPIITNMICDKLDRRLAGLAKRFGLNYTRYADDITFSSMHNVYRQEGEFFTELQRIIDGQGFRLNEKKTRLQKTGSRQEVTGLIVSSRINVTQTYVRDLRNILYIWKRYGYRTAMSKFMTRYKADKGELNDGPHDPVKVIKGKLMYMKMVKGSEDPVFQRLYTRFSALESTLSAKGRTTEGGVTFVETMPLHEFELKFNTRIEIKEKAKDAKTIRYGIFALNGRNEVASIAREVSGLTELEHLSISFCRNNSEGKNNGHKKGKTFWLIHRKRTSLLAAPKPVNVDELNRELDELLKGCSKNPIETDFEII